MITGAAELYGCVGGQVFQTLAGNAYRGFVRVGGSDTAVVVGEILHDSLGVVGSGRKDSRSVILTPYRNERSAHLREALAVQADGRKPCDVPRVSDDSSDAHTVAASSSESSVGSEMVGL